MDDKNTLKKFLLKLWQVNLSWPKQDIHSLNNNCFQNVNPGWSDQGIIINIPSNKTKKKALQNK